MLNLTAIIKIKRKWKEKWRTKPTIAFDQLMNDVRRKKETDMRCSWKLDSLGFDGKGGNYRDDQGGVTTKKRNHNQCEDLGLLLAWKTHVYKRRKTLPPIMRINQNTIYCNLPTLQAFQDCKRIFLQIDKKTSKRVFFELLKKWAKRIFLQIKSWEKTITIFSMAIPSLLGIVSLAPLPMTSPIHNLNCNNKNNTPKNKQINPHNILNKLFVRHSELHKFGWNFLASN